MPVLKLGYYLKVINGQLYARLVKKPTEEASSICSVAIVLVFPSPDVVGTAYIHCVVRWELDLVNVVRFYLLPSLAKQYACSVN